MTDDQIKAECARVAAIHRTKTCIFYPALGVVESWPRHTRTAAIAAERRGKQVWALIKGEWVRPFVCLTPTDSEMLNWMCQEGRYISTSRDSENCNVWCRDPEDGDMPVEGYPQKCYLTPREAIAAAMKVRP